MKEICTEALPAGGAAIAPSGRDPGAALAEHADAAPLCPGVYRLYEGERLVHVGMAAGAATLRSELMCHARGEYGPHTQRADRAEWEVAPDAMFAYRRFLTVYASAMYTASGSAANDPAPSASRRHSR